MDMLVQHLWLPARLRTDCEIKKDSSMPTLRWLRGGALMGVILGSVGVYAGLSGRVNLTGLGLISMVGLVQCAPALLGLLFWRGAGGGAAAAGMLVGTGAWLGLTSVEVYSLQMSSGQGMNAAGALAWDRVLTMSLLLNAGVFILFSLLGGRVRKRDMARGKTMALETLRERLRAVLGKRDAALIWERAGAGHGHGNGAPELTPVRLRRWLTPLLGPVGVECLFQDSRGSDAAPLLYRRLRVVAGDQPGALWSFAPGEQSVDDLLLRYGMLLRALPVGVALINAQGRVVLWNRELERISGLREQMMVGNSWDQFVEPWRGWVRQARTLDPAKGALGTWRLYRWRGRVLGLRWLVLHGPPRGKEYLLLVEDVTAREQQRTREAERKRLVTAGRLVLGLSHEIGNPLMALQMLGAEWLQEARSSERERVRQMMELTRRIGLALQEVRTVVKAAVRLDKEPNSDIQSPIVLAPIVLGECLREAIDEARRSTGGALQHRNVVVSLGEAEETARLAGDRQLFVQALAMWMRIVHGPSEEGTALYVRGLVADEKRLRLVISRDAEVDGRESREEDESIEGAEAATPEVELAMRLVMALGGRCAVGMGVAWVRLELFLAE